MNVMLLKNENEGKIFVKRTYSKRDLKDVFVILRNGCKHKYDALFAKKFI